MSTLDWVTGDALKRPLPAHSIALRTDALRFLTEAFHLSGVLPSSNLVAAMKFAIARAI